ncbi:MAG: hypothetical protein NT140_07755, partial [Deltaproteobacteria bacterium]|nr:hypothetical protein [Deltaproteobacteria bacterium]
KIEPALMSVDIPWLLQHVMISGSGGRDIFIDDGERRLFFPRFSKLLAETDTGMPGIKADLQRQRNRVKVLADVRAVVLPGFHTIFAIIID